MEEYTWLSSMSFSRKMRFSVECFADRSTDVKLMAQSAIDDVFSATHYIVAGIRARGSYECDT